MRFWLVVFWLAMSLLWAVQGRATTHSAWRTLPATDYNIYFQEGDSLTAMHIAAVLRRELPIISGELGAALAAPIGVFVAPSLASFNHLTGGSIPHWGEAVADPIKQLMIIKSPRWSPSESPLNVIVIHELVHLLIGRIVGGGQVPRWLNEGLAIYYSGETAYASGTEVSRAQFSGQLIPLATIDAVLTFEKLRANLAYQQAYLAVVYIVETYGESAIPELLHTIAEKKDFAPAFEAVFGMTLDRFEQDWHRYLQERYRWSLLLEFENFLWLFILLLFILAFILILRRNRRVIKQWDANELTGHSPPPEI